MSCDTYQHVRWTENATSGSLPVGNMMCPWIALVVSVYLLSILQPTDAQTEIGFEFFEKYSSISHDVGSFRSFLLTDIKGRYNFSSLRNSVISPFKVTNGTGGSIRVNLTLNIDTENSINVLARKRFEASLRQSSFVLQYNSSFYWVNNATVWFRVGFWDLWHEHVAEIVIVVFCGLAALAIFVASLQLLCMNLNRSKYRTSPKGRSTFPSQGGKNSIGRTNGGFVMDEVNGGQRVHTPKSSIGSTRFAFDRDTVFDKLTYAAYEVPAKQMNSFL